jgi:hypothetical protein
MSNILLRALEYARNGEFSLARDLLSDFVTRSALDESDLDYAERRINELEARA